MRYFLFMFIGQDQYTYKQTLHDTRSRDTVEACMSYTTGLRAHFDSKNITCWSYMLTEHDPDTGDIRLIKQEFFKHPLKTRMEINKPAKEAPRKAPAEDEGIRWVYTGLAPRDLAIDPAQAPPVTARPRVRTNPQALANEVIERERAIRRERDRIVEDIRNNV